MRFYSVLTFRHDSSSVPNHLFTGDRLVRSDKQVWKVGLALGCSIHRWVPNRIQASSCCDLDRNSLESQVENKGLM